MILGKCREDRCTLFGILSRGSYLQSTNKMYKLTLKENGNLEISCGSRIYWQTGTINSTIDCLYLSQSGKPALIGEDYSKIWRVELLPSSRTVNLLIIQDDGNLVVYDQCGKALWESETQGGCNNVIHSQGLVDLLYLFNTCLNFVHCECHSVIVLFVDGYDVFVSYIMPYDYETIKLFLLDWNFFYKEIQNLEADRVCL